MSDIRRLGPKKPEGTKFPEGYEIGAVVTLKMGGVLMCITEMLEGLPLTAYCEWHADGFSQEKAYPVACLRLARKNEFEEVEE